MRAKNLLDLFPGITIVRPTIELTPFNISCPVESVWLNVKSPGPMLCRANLKETIIYPELRWGEITWQNNNRRNIYKKSLLCLELHVFDMYLPIIYIMIIIKKIAKFERLL